MQLRVTTFGKVQKALFLAGFALVTGCALSYVTGIIRCDVAVTRFKSELVHKRQSSTAVGVSGVDITLWSDKRIRDYRTSLATYDRLPMALLKVPKIRLEVPVFDGTDQATLNRGVGRIAGTARPGEKGNVAIAGHRDGFFRRLKYVSTSDTLELLTRSGTDTYVVDSVRIVEPEDVTVLRTGPEPSVTLITCYPFYFIGSAPRRFVVHASIRPMAANQTSEAAQTRSTALFTVNSQEKTK